MVTRRKAPPSRLERLISDRDLVRVRLANDDGKHTAPMAKVLLELEREIAQLELAVPKGSVVDDLASRRKTRAGDAAKSKPAASGSRKK